MTGYRIAMKKKDWGWTSMVDGTDCGDFYHPRWWWRPSHRRAKDAALRWCQRHHEREHRDLTFTYTPHRKWLQ